MSVHQPLSLAGTQPLCWPRGRQHAQQHMLKDGKRFQRQAKN